MRTHWETGQRDTGTPSASPSLESQQNKGKKSQLNSIAMCFPINQCLSAPVSPSTPSEQVKIFLGDKVWFRVSAFFFSHHESHEKTPNLRVSLNNEIIWQPKVGSLVSLQNLLIPARLDTPPYTCGGQVDLMLSTRYKSCIWGSTKAKPLSE